MIDALSPGANVVLMRIKGDNDINAIGRAQ
jgi:hypothetical protein